MSNQRYTEDFKREAVAQIAEHGYKIKDVSERLGVSDKSLYAWCKRYANPSPLTQDNAQLQLEVARLKKQLKRVEQERQILKEAAQFFASESKNVTRSYKNR